MTVSIHLPFLDENFETDVIVKRSLLIELNLYAATSSNIINTDIAAEIKGSLTE